MCQGNALSAILAAGHLRHDLHGDITCRRKTVRFVNKGLADDCAIFQHIFQIDKITVVHMLGIIVGIVEMNQSLPVCLHDFFWQQKPSRQIFAHFPGHIITLYTVNNRIFIGIFL